MVRASFEAQALVSKNYRHKNADGVSMVYLIRTMRLIQTIALLLFAMVLSAQDTKLATRRVSEFMVVGLRTRTNTARELNGPGSIAGVWKRMLEQKLIEQIPNRSSDELIAVYSDFVNGKDGEYNYVLGVKVNSVNKLPAGMVAQQAGGGTYAVLTSEGQLLGDMIVSAWKQIWAREQAHTLEHVYANDFEVHYPGPPDDPKHTAMDLFVRVRAD